MKSSAASAMRNVNDSSYTEGIVLSKQVENESGSKEDLRETEGFRWEYFLQLLVYRTAMDIPVLY